MSTRQALAKVGITFQCTMWRGVFFIRPICTQEIYDKFVLFNYTYFVGLRSNRSFASNSLKNLYPWRS